MRDDQQILSVLLRHGVRFVIVGGHAVIFHGFLRATEDVDVVWLRSLDSERSLYAALSELEARYIGNDIDPATGIERAYAVSPSYIQAHHLMMLSTRLGFLDLFDYVPGFPQQDPAELMPSSVEFGGLRYASLDHLRKMKQAAGRAKDQLDLENLP
ncbi:MAG TPA: hypothetical protein VHY37_04875 [Tepidisphaeraceae bacterium]|jgi:hypothetical protein|nr:hypothetical protein [Tepidisphaeraceae bacterium]